MDMLPTVRCTSMTDHISLARGDPDAADLRMIHQCIRIAADLPGNMRRAKRAKVRIRRSSRTTTFSGLPTSLSTALQRQRPISSSN